MSEEQPPRRLRDNPWVRKLPLLGVALVGLFFLLPSVPKDVEVDYDLGRASKSLTRADVEILDGEGRRVHRTVFNTPERHLVQHLRLPKGDYRAEVELEYADHTERRARRFAVGDAEAVDLDLEQP